MVLSIAAACILLPAVEITYRFLTHKRHKRGAIALVFLIVPTIMFSVGGLVAYFAFQQAGTLAQDHLLWLVVVFVLVRMLVEYVLQPMLMGSAGLGTSPIVTSSGALLERPLPVYLGCCYQYPSRQLSGCSTGTP